MPTRYSKYALLLCLLLSLTQRLHAQSDSLPRRWQIEVTFDYLFDNKEFETSPIGESYTLAGVWVRPTLSLGLGNNSEHRLYLGANLLKEMGTRKVIDTAHLTAYYQIQYQGWEARIGLFPSYYVTDHLSERFIERKAQFLRPIMNGIQLSQRGDHHFVNLWLDWLTKKGATDRERFHAGLTTKYHRGIFVAESNLRMMHLATSDVAHTVLDDLQGELLLGIQNHFATFNYGIAVGLYSTIERDRYEQKCYRNIGTLGTFNADWKKRIGLNGYIYYGTGHQQMRGQYGSLLYFEHPMLQAPLYLQTVGYWQIFDTHFRGKLPGHCAMRLELGLHFLPSALSSHQALTLSVQIP